MPATPHIAAHASTWFSVGALTPLLIKVTNKPNLTFREAFDMIPGFWDGLDEEGTIEVNKLCDDAPARIERKFFKTVHDQLVQQYDDHKAGKETYPIQPFFVKGKWGVKNIGVAANGKTRIIVTSPHLNVETGELETGPDPLTTHLPGA